MSTARDLALDPDTYDLLIVGQDLAPLISDYDAIVSDVEATLKFMAGEWFADLSQGIPYFQQLLIKAPNLPAFRTLLFKAIGARLGIIQVQYVTITVNAAARTASIVWAAFADDTLLGSTVVVSP
jgi:hypothetical protein